MSDVPHTDKKKKRGIVFFNDYKLVVTDSNAEIYNEIMENRKIILFDGFCNFFNYWVNFAIKRDKKKKLKFTTLQGETAKQLLPEYHINPTSLSSVIFIDKGKAYTQSSAAIRICKYLNGGWKIFYGLMIIPKFIRD